jgi:hypothetical protein
MLQPAVADDSTQAISQPLVQPTVPSANDENSNDRFPKFDRRTAIGLGTTLIVVAILGMIMSGIDIMNANAEYPVAFTGHGFWIGAMVGIAILYCRIS